MRGGRAACERGSGETNINTRERGRMGSMKSGRKTQVQAREVHGTWIAAFCSNPRTLINPDTST